MNEKKQSDAPEQEETLEETMEGLRELIRTLEEGQLSLEDSFRLYKEGMQKLSRCDALLDRVEKELLILEEG
ncbi:MAG: exodeoxyribonuclease VII small subunit [Lachnospiraceae bacterium]|nr:exodeoxyribonuclease VII small subunit [Lachnospiraceae bacterium]